MEMKNGGYYMVCLDITSDSEYYGYSGFAFGLLHLATVLFALLQ